MHRWIRACLVALLVTSTTATAGGFADPGTGLEGTFQTAEPRIGDEGLYRWTVYVDGQAAESWDAFAFRQDAPVQMVNSDRMERPTSALSWHAAGQTDLDEPDSWGFRDDWVWQLYDLRADGRFDALRQGFVNGHFDRLDYPIESYATPCGMRHAAQSGITLDGATPLFGACWLDLNERNDDYDASGLRRYGSDFESEPLWYPIHLSADRDTLVLQDGKHGGAQVWLEADIPYPTQWLLTDRERMDVVHVIRLERFHAGQQPVQPAGIGKPEPFPMHTMKPWGLDHGDLDHPWLPRDAWMAAMDEPAVGEWLDDHPDAVLASYGTGVGGRVIEAEGGRFGWVFRMADSEAGVAIQSGRVYDPAPGEEAFTEVVLEEASELSPDEKEALTGQAPTFHSLVGARAALHPDAYEVDGWSMGVWGGEVQFTLYSMMDMRSRDTPGQLERMLSGQDGQDIKMVFGEAGHIRSMSNYWGAVATPAPSGPGGGATNAAVLDADYPTWALPGPVVWTLAGLGGILSFLLYFFWPGLKFGGIALLSRGTPETVLRQPLRREVFEQVEANPGTHVRELARVLERSRSTIDHHLRRLERVGLVRREVAGYACFYARDAPTTTPAKSDGAKAITHALGQGIESGLGLVRATGLTRSTVHYHLAALEKARVVEKVQRGRWRLADPA